MTDKLKPCPFCGKKARPTLLINTRDGTATDAVICGNSRCRVRPHVDAATVPPPLPPLEHPKGRES